MLPIATIAVDCVELLLNLTIAQRNTRIKEIVKAHLGDLNQPLYEVS